MVVTLHQHHSQLVVVVVLMIQVGVMELLLLISGSQSQLVRLEHYKVLLATIPSLGDVTAGGKIVIDQNQPIEFHLTQGERDRIIRDNTSNAMNMLSRAHIGLIIDSNNDDTDAEFTIRANGLTHLPIYSFVYSYTTRINKPVQQHQLVRLVM